MSNLTQTQMTAIVAALGCVLALIAAFIHDRRMTAQAAEGKPWVRPVHPLLMLLIATVLSVMTAVLVLQGR